MMGCVLGPTLANFYMGHLEMLIMKILLEQDKEVPIIYCRYIDDIYVVVNSEEELEYLRSIFEENSVLNFTYEMENNKQIKFLACNIIRKEDKIETEVYIKETFDGNYLNYSSICPMRYKTGIIKTLLHRASLISSSWIIFNNEVNRLKQILVNNGYPLFVIDKQVNNFMNTKFKKKPIESEDITKVNLFFKNQMTDNYKQRETQLKNIVNKNVKGKDNSTKVNLMIYYKNLKLKDITLSPK